VQREMWNESDQGQSYKFYKGEKTTRSKTELNEEGGGARTFRGGDLGKGREFAWFDLGGGTEGRGLSLMHKVLDRERA